MAYPPYLSGRTRDELPVHLRALEFDDISLLQRWGNDEQLRKTLSRPRPLDSTSEQEWLERMRKSRSDVVFMIQAQCDPVGTVGLHCIDWVNRSAELGILLGDMRWEGQGIASTAYRLVQQYAFRELNLVTLLAHIIGSNKKSIDLHEACGFTEVGRIPNGHWKNGGWEDDILFHLSRETWEQRREQPPKR